MAGIFNRRDHSAVFEHSSDADFEAGSVLDPIDARPEADELYRLAARGETQGASAIEYDDFTRQAGAAKAP